MHRSLEEARAADLKYRTHFKRFWFLYLFIFLVIDAALALGLIYGIIPLVAQNCMNAAIIHVQGLSIKSPMNDQITLDMNSTVSVSVPVYARMEPQEFEMHLPYDPSQAIFMKLPLEGMDVKDKMHITVKDWDTEILNGQVWREFAKSILTDQTLVMGVKSKPTIKIGPVGVGVDLKKNITLKGFNGLKGIMLHNATILDKPLEDGTNVMVDGMIPNFSSFVLEVGDLTTDIAASGIKLGYAVIKNLTMVPGPNYVKIYNHVDPGFLNMPIFKDILNQTDVKITLTMNSTVYNGEHVQWLEGPLRETSPYYATLNPKGADTLVAAPGNGSSTLSVALQGDAMKPMAQANLLTF
ncbi:hypothetical protein TWF694_008393 [Orbilia ellipsospora]|uniref:Uncharacterized protein n=1 Tax=Orbilia ellipsospora TaxID=2528407 RepID=A0AAV9XJD4_9PEZI